MMFLIIIIIIRPHVAHDEAKVAYSHQTFPPTICWSVCLVHCGKMADLIWMLFQMGPGIRQVVGFGDRSTGGDNLAGGGGANVGSPIQKKNCSVAVQKYINHQSELQFGLVRGVYQGW